MKFPAPTTKSHGGRSAEKTPLVFLAFAYLLTGATLTLVGFPNVAAFDLPSPDDYMRLQQVRDWLGGQAWHDVNQHRFVTEAGGDMHFSRFPDVLMAGLIMLFKPFLGAHGAEIAMLTIYPVLLLLPLFWVTAKLATHVGGRRAGYAAAAITPFMYATLWQFSSGHIDHHSLQIVLLMCAVYFAVRAVELPKLSLGVAASLIAMMVVGVETLPFVAAVSLGVGVAWLANGHKDLMLYFGGGLVLFAFPLLFLEQAGGNPFAPHCDAYSPVFATAATMTGLGAMILGLLTPRLNCMGARFLSAAGVGAIAVLVSALAFPDCLPAGPLSVIDGEALEFWLQNAPQIRSALHVLLEDGQYHEAYRYLIPLAGFIAAINLLREHRGPKRLQMLIICLAVGAGVILCFWRLRTSSFAAALAILPMAIMLGEIRERLKDFSPRSVFRAGLIGLLVSPIPYMGGSFAAAAIKPATTPGKSESVDAAYNLRGVCSRPEHVRSLRALPAGLFMNQFEFGIGQRVLVLTDHSISTAFYHRNADAALRSARFYDGAADKAVCELSRRPVDYVLYCPDPNRIGNYDLDKPSLSEMLQAGETPGWLEEIEVEGAAPLRVFKPRLSVNQNRECALGAGR